MPPPVQNGNTRHGGAGWWGSLTSQMPPRQFGRYVLVGSFNTMLGYGTFAAMTRLLEPLGRHSYLLANILSSSFNLAAAFLLHKHYAFRSKGNWRRECARYLAVYGSSMALGFIALPVVVTALRLLFGWERQAPYVAAAFLTVFGVIYNFIGNKRYSFRDAADSPSKRPVD